MTVHRNETPPEPWLRPVQNNQPTLFQDPTEEWLARTRVSRDELKRWQELGWISFDVDASPTLDEPEQWELCFVRNIVRSGLSDEQINEILGELSKPYRYDPMRTAYNFAWGWVQCPSMPDMRDIYEIIDENLSEWIEEQVANGNTDRLGDLMFEIVQLRRAGDKPDCSNDEETS